MYFEWSEVSFTIFYMFNLQNSLTVIVEVNVVWKGLVLGREVGSLVLQKPPFYPVFILLFLPPYRKKMKKIGMYLSK